MGRGSQENAKASVHLHGAVVSRSIESTDYQRLIDEHELPETGSLARKYLRAASDYGYSGRFINGDLREMHSTGAEKWHGHRRRQVRTLDAAMMPSTFDAVVLRGMRIPKGKVVNVGDAIENAGYTGTTPSLKEARRFAAPNKMADGLLVELSVPAGTPYLPIIKYVGRDRAYRKTLEEWMVEEAEILWGRNHSIAITEVLKTHITARGEIHRCRGDLLPGNQASSIDLRSLASA